MNTFNITSSPQTNEEISCYKLINNLKTKIETKTKDIGEGSGYVYDGIVILHIHFRKVYLNRGAWYIKLPKWLQSKGAVVNPQNHNDIHCFAYSIAIALFNEEVCNHPERINDNLKWQVNRLNFKNIGIYASFHDYQTFEKNNEDIALNVFFISQNSKKVKQEYISKHNYTRNKQVALLKITNGEKWHFTALKSLRQDDKAYNPAIAFSRLIRNIASNSHENHYCYGCLYSYRTQSKLKEHYELCKNHKHCEIKTLKKGTNFLTHK